MCAHALHRRVPAGLVLLLLLLLVARVRLLGEGETLDVFARAPGVPHRDRAVMRSTRMSRSRSQRGGGGRRRGSSCCGHGRWDRILRTRRRRRRRGRRRHRMHHRAGRPLLGRRTLSASLAVGVVRGSLCRTATSSSIDRRWGDSGGGHIGGRRRSGSSVGGRGWHRRSGPSSTRMIRHRCSSCRCSSSGLCIRRHGGGWHSREWSYRDGGVGGRCCRFGFGCGLGVDRCGCSSRCHVCGCVFLSFASRCLPPAARLCWCWCGRVGSGAGGGGAGVSRRRAGSERGRERHMMRGGGGPRRRGTSRDQDAHLDAAGPPRALVLHASLSGNRPTRLRGPGEPAARAHPQWCPNHQPDDRGSQPEGAREGEDRRGERRSLGAVARSGRATGRRTSTHQDERACACTVVRAPHRARTIPEFSIFACFSSALRRTSNSRWKPSGGVYGLRCYELN